MDESYNTLLHHACAKNRIDMVSVLLNRGAVINPVNYYGETPLARAAVAGFKELVSSLEAQGGGRMSSVHANFYPLHAAVMDEAEGRVQELLASGHDPNQLDYLQVSVGGPRRAAVAGCLWASI